MRLRCCVVTLFCCPVSFSLQRFNHSDLNQTRFWCIVVPFSSLLLTMSGLRSFHVQWRSVYQDLSRKLLYILWMEEILHQLVDGVDGVSRFDPIICTVLKLPIVKVTNWCGISSIHSSLDDIRSRIPAYLISLIQDSWTVSWWRHSMFFPTNSLISEHPLFLSFAFAGCPAIIPYYFMLTCFTCFSSHLHSRAQHTPGCANT